MPDRTALIAGVTGISGFNLAERLLADGWTVYGLARNPDAAPKGVLPVAADLLDPAALRGAVAGLDITHVFVTTWLRQPTEAENCRVNGSMIANLLQRWNRPQIGHVALVTGLKHYLGPFEAYAKAKPETPFREEQERLPYQNFYYVQEDILFEAAARPGFSWSVHRPHTLIGWALGNAMNMGVTLACLRRDLQGNGTALRLPRIAGAVRGGDRRDRRSNFCQAAGLGGGDPPTARNQALNIVNGDVFRWRRLWTVRSRPRWGLTPRLIPAGRRLSRSR